MSVAVYFALRFGFGDALGRGTRMLLAWDAGLLVFFAFTARTMFGSTGDDIRERAESLDEGAAGVLLLTVVASAVSVGAIAVELSGATEADGLEKALRSALGGFTVLLSWLFVHVSFALHYAHAHYNIGEDEQGVDFPGKDEEPDYWDFLYFSFNFGAAMQTSDVDIVDPRIRRVALGQTIVAWIFNTTIIALAVSLGGDLLSGK